MTRSTASLLILILLITPLAVLHAGIEDDTSRLQNMPHDAQGVPLLKDIYASKFLIGTAIDFRSPDEFSAKELEIIKSQFNVVTPENSMKSISTHLALDKWDFTEADRLVTFCQENNIQVVGHNLVWHAQTGGFFFTGPDGKPVTRDLAIARLKEHIRIEVTHFKGKLKGWDVVNEAISDNGGDRGQTENLRQSPWFKSIGPDYITMAFKFAHEADPKVELYYNDYNIEHGAKHKSSMLLLQRLVRDGAPITGVGIQGHWSLASMPYKDIDQAITDYASLGLKVNISELDIAIAGEGGGQLQQAPPAGVGPATASTGQTATGRRRRAQGPQNPPTANQLQAQAEAYAKLFDIFQKHQDAILRVTFWGLNDKRSWRRGQSPLLFDENNNPKPAIRAIALANK